MAENKQAPRLQQVQEGEETSSATPGVCLRAVPQPAAKRETLSTRASGPSRFMGGAMRQAVAEQERGVRRGRGPVSIWTAGLSG